MTKLIIVPLEMAGQAPEWLRILPLGQVQLRDGRQPFEVDADSLHAIVNNFKAGGVDLVVDYEHQSLGIDKAPAAGWIKDLEARSDGLYARIEWTAVALEHIEASEYRYYSPVLKMDPETRRPTALMHAALTNIPAIKGLAPLLAAKYGGEAEEPEVIILVDITAQRSAQLARSEQYGIGVKSSGHDSLCSGMQDIPEDQWGDPVNYRFPIPDPAIKAREVLQQWENPEVRGEYSATEQIIIDERIKSRAKAVGMQIQEANSMKEKLMKLLGITGEQPDEEILALADTRLKQSGALPEIAQALGLKAEATVSEITGTVLALKQGAEQLTTLQGEVAALKAESAKTKAAAAVDEALKAGKLTPAQQDWAMEYAGRDLEGFKVFVEKAPKAVPVGEEFRIAREGATGPEGLTPDELSVCKQTGITPEAFKAEKTRLAAQAG